MRYDEMIVPEEMSPELAEIFGILAGDGYVRTRGPFWVWVEGGKEERSYIDERVAPLFSKVFGLSVKPRFFDRHGKKNDDYGIRICSKKLACFFAKFNLDVSHDFVQVPRQILDDKGLWPGFLRGYIDTDGYINFFTQNGRYCSYPRVGYTTVSENLSKQVSEMFERLGFSISTWSKLPKKGNRKRVFCMEMKGTKNLSKCVSDIGFSNPCKISRYLVWKRFGFCPSFTREEERRLVLSGHLNIDSLIGRQNFPEFSKGLNPAEPTKLHTGP